MEEKYYILNNMGQYYLIFKCMEQKMYDYANYGFRRCISCKGTIDLNKTSKWLITHNIKHTAVYNRVANLLLRRMIKKDISYMHEMADLSGLLISDEEIENALIYDQSNVIMIN